MAETLLKRLKGNVQEVRPHEISLSALDLSGMENRNQAVQAKADITAEDTDHSIP